MKILTLALVLIAGLSSCKQTTKNLMPSVTGKAGEVIVIVNDPLWKGAMGDTLKSIFSEEQIGLPQSEPVMDVFHISHEALTSVFKTHRSILDVRVSKNITENKLSVKTGLWAKGQALIIAEASSRQGMIDLLHSNRSKILAFFLSSEKKRLVKEMQKKPEKNIFNKLKKKKNFTLSCPSGYNINKDFGDFIWISKETPKTSQGMFVYTFDYTNEEAFSEKFLLNKRDSLLKAYVPGPSAGSYMRTERRYPVSFRQFSFKENYAVETRGLWKVEKDFMGGPFLNICFLDKEANRVICLDGYVYNPNKDKRDLLRELEAIMFTFEFVR
ncbi:MAG: DUF4837 family protein [Marinifilaceae bacterium]